MGPTLGCGDRAASAHISPLVSHPTSGIPLRENGAGTGEFGFQENPAETAEFQPGELHRAGQRQHLHVASHRAGRHRSVLPAR